MRLITALGLLAFAGLAYLLYSNFGGMAAWAVEQQRGFQNLMAGAIRGLKAGEAGALLALFSAAGAYGFVHAVGPGHGKYLVGGVGLGTEVAPLKLVSVAIASSLAQALWAVVLVYGGFAIVSATANQMTSLAEDILAPLSYLAIGAIGIYLFWRGLCAFPAREKHTKACETHHSHDCGCHSHGPAPEEVARLTSLRETLALIASIAVRPCTGAIFLLVIAWQLDIRLAGALAVIVMGLGTALLTTTVAISSIAARRLALISVEPSFGGRAAFATAQMAAGIVILAFSLALIGVIS